MTDNRERPAVESAFANLPEGAEVAFEFENENRDGSRIHVIGYGVFAENIMACMIQHAESGFIRVKNADDVAQLINHALRLSGSELRYDHAYNKDGIAHDRVDTIEADTSKIELTPEEEREYETVDQVRYRVHRV